MATVSDGIQYTLEQKIVPTIFEAGWKLDPIFPMIARSSMDVRRNSYLGRGWNVLKTWSEGIAGGAKFATVGGGNIVTPGVSATTAGPMNFVQYSSHQTFPSFDETTAPAFFQSTVTLIEQRGNFYLPHTILRADRLNSSIGSVVGQNLKGVSKLLAQQEASLFYSAAPSTGALAAIGDTSVTVDDVIVNVGGSQTDTSAMVFDLGGTDATGRIHRFLQGMMVDLYDSTGATKRNVGYYLTVDNVDPIEEKLVIRRTDGGTFTTTTTLGGGVTYATAGGDDDIIVLKDSVSVLPKGLESWIIPGTSASYDFFGIDVRDHGSFKSYVPSAVSAALTERVLNKYFGFFYESFPGKELDCAITTMGVLIGFIDNIDTANQGGVTSASSNTVYPGRYMYDRNGQALDVEAGWDAFNYRFASRKIKIYTSTYAQKGNFYAGKFKNGGITRYVPPALPNARVDSRFGTEVEFVAPLGGTGGYQGIFKHHHSTSGATTDFIEAPFVRQWNLMPEQPNFMKLSSITEVLG